MSDIKRFASTNLIIIIERSDFYLRAEGATKSSRLAGSWENGGSRHRRALSPKLLERNCKKRHNCAPQLRGGIKGCALHVPGHDEDVRCGLGAAPAARKRRRGSARLCRATRRGCRGCSRRLGARMDRRRRGRRRPRRDARFSTISAFREPLFSATIREKRGAIRARATLRAISATPSSVTDRDFQNPEATSQSERTGCTPWTRLHSAPLAGREGKRRESAGRERARGSHI